jgi:single-strand selective monofunctional uracil DNA glycosylase
MSAALKSAGRALCEALGPLEFSGPITHVYNPLEYAWSAQVEYLERYGGGRKRIVFLGMNPGPWGMAQTGVPFGEVAAVRDWMGIRTVVGRPSPEHAKRPVLGFACEQSEVSGRRLWGLMAGRFGTAGAFFEEHFVANYCPLVFMEGSGKNFTPDKLPVAEGRAVEAACDVHLAAVVAALEPEWLIGVGAFAEAQGRKQLGRFPGLKVGRILHPSPASPAANKDWAGTVTGQMMALGAWS